MSDSGDALDLQELLNKTSGDFPDLPDLPPKKTFYGKLTGEVTAGRSRERQTPYYNFKVRLTDRGKDVTDAEMAVIAAAGFNLGDYPAGVNFYLTPGAMPMFRRFCDSIGLDPNKTFREKLRVDANGVPTQETTEIIRGIDVTCITPEKGNNGRVYVANMDQVGGRNNNS